VLTASTAIAQVAIGVAARLGRSLGDAARDALAWVVPANGGAPGEHPTQATTAPPVRKPFSDELILCWCCGASSSCRC